MAGVSGSGLDMLRWKCLIDTHVEMADGKPFHVWETVDRRSRVTLPGSDDS